MFLTTEIKGDRNMNAYKGIAMIILMISSMISSNALGAMREPARPHVDRIFDVQKEARINELAGLPAREAFERMKAVEYRSDKDLMYKAVNTAFHGRKSEAVMLARSYMGLPLTEVVGDRVILSGGEDFLVAKRIFETFPEDAAPVLVSLYEQGDAVTRGNIVRAAGNVAGGQEIRNLLVQALNDTSVYEEERPDSSGKPMRICDLAYNQLVLRYQVRNVLRTISPALRTENRDYHIGILKGML
jgi:hypothetical protein